MCGYDEFGGTEHSQREHTLADQLTNSITVFFQFLLLEIRVALHLVHRWNHLGHLEKIGSFCDGEV